LNSVFRSSDKHFVNLTHHAHPLGPNGPITNKGLAKQKASCRRGHRSLPAAPARFVCAQTLTKQLLFTVSFYPRACGQQSLEVLFLRGPNGTSKQIPVAT